MKRFTVAIVTVVLVASPLFAWDGKGHMTVAYIAYKNLSDDTRIRVDELLKKNPQYHSWTNGVPKKKRGLVAFLNAAMWPDCIKSANKCPGYTADGTDNGNTPPPGPEASRNIGYADKLMHKYWHFVDKPFSPSHLPTEDPASSNALLQMTTFIAAIADSDISDDIKSYDVTWLTHLVGDVHQPLHTASRFTKGHPPGDNGGNSIKFCSGCDDNLHAFWDNILGTETDLTTIQQLGDTLLSRPKPAGADLLDVSTWVNESFALAKQRVYVAPITSDEIFPPQPSMRPNQAYKHRAKGTSENQVLLAGYRLAALLNAHLN
jgi:S1/P1 nuclease